MIDVETAIIGGGQAGVPLVHPTLCEAIKNAVAAAAIDRKA